MQCMQVWKSQSALRTVSTQHSLYKKATKATRNISHLGLCLWLSGERRGGAGMKINDSVGALITAAPAHRALPLCLRAGV